MARSEAGGRGGVKDESGPARLEPGFYGGKSWDKLRNCDTFQVADGSGNLSWGQVAIRNFGGVDDVTLTKHH